MSKVALIRCESYDDTQVKNAVERGLKLLGGLSNFISTDEKILLKPNILIGEKPEKCVTTHPSIFRAAAEMLTAAGARVSYGDSPAIGKPAGAARKAGLKQAAEQLNIPLADFSSGVDIFTDQGLQKRKFTIAKGVMDSDAVISLPKLKTHGLEKITGAVKNQFGCIPGLLKSEFHLKLPDADDFAKMLVDLNHFIKPRLYIMDGIQAMEGNGPRGGTPKRMNLILLSPDPIALDATVCRLIKLDPAHVPTLVHGMQIGMGSFLEKDIQLLGDNFESFVPHDFKVDRKPYGRKFKPGLFSVFLNNRIVSKPVIEEKSCVQCGICVKICPAEPKAVFFKNRDRSKPPVYNYDDCIRCFCCQEMCPESAIEIRRPIVRKLIDFMAD